MLLDVATSRLRPGMLNPIGSWKRGAAGTGQAGGARDRKNPEPGTTTQGEPDGDRDTTSSGLARHAKSRKPWASGTPGGTDQAPRPPLHGHRIRDEEIVKEGFVGPPAGRVRLQPSAISENIKQKSGPAGPLFCFEPKNVTAEDLPDLPAGRQATAGRSITATTSIVPPQRGHRRGSTSYTFRMRRAQERRTSRGARSSVPGTGSTAWAFARSLCRLQ